MKKLPGTLQDGRATFPPTRWSVVSACAAPDRAVQGDARSALDRLCRDYWPPLYSFVRRRGYSSQDAQDLVQGFFTFLLETDLCARVDRARGKFRAFLLAALKNYLSDQQDHRRRLKRGGAHHFVWLDDESVRLEEPSAPDLHARPAGDEEKDFERRWALVVVTRALDGLAEEFAGSEADARTFAELRPFLTGGAELPDPRTTAAELGVSVENLRNQISRLRVRFRQSLREEIAHTVAAEGDLDDEMRYLLRVLLSTP